MMQRFLLTLIFLISTLLFIANGFALPTNEIQKTWINTNFFSTFTDDPKWKMWNSQQLRFFGPYQNLEVTLITNAIGYQFAKNWSVWAGDLFLTDNLFHNTGTQNFIFQQLIWIPINNKKVSFSVRNRLEEASEDNQRQWFYRVRELFVLRFPNMLFKKLTPHFFDEMFINLNSVRWVPTKTFAENRLFLGVDFPLNKKNYLSVGYMNQQIYGLRRTDIGHILFMSLDINN